MPLHRGKLKAFTTLMAISMVRRVRESSDDDDVKLVSVPWDSVRSIVRYRVAPPADDAASAAPSRTSPPEHPEESVPVAPLPRTIAAWKQLQETFTAGSKGPVRLPVDESRPIPNVPSGHVLIPSTAVHLLLGRSTGDIQARAFLARKTADEVRAGSVEYTIQDNVSVILPVFVVYHPSTGKPRIIYDGRALNRHLKESSGSVRYESVRDVLYLRAARVGTKLDIQSAFRHVLVDAEQRRLLGFVVEGSLFRYRCLPFGISWSPALFIRCLQPAITAARRAGITIVWYVDDILITAPTVQQLDNDMVRLLGILRDHGWAAAKDKTFPHAYSAVPFLGLLVQFRNDASPVLKVPDVKRQRICDELDVMLGQGFVHTTLLQKIVGRANWLRIILTEIGFTRTSFDRAIAAASSADGRVPVTGRLKEDALALRALLSKEEVAHRTLTLEDTCALEAVTVYSDASEFGWGVLRIDRNGPFAPPPHLGVEGARGWTEHDEFTAEEKQLSSGAREIRAILHGIIAMDLRDVSLAWHSDATAAVGAIGKWASPAAGVSDALRELWTEVQARNLRLHVVHVARSVGFMPVADWISRLGWRDRQAEWFFAPHDVVAICRRLGAVIDADMFASLRNRRCLQYCSRYAEAGSWGDAFFTEWGGRHWWAFPPFSQRSRVLARLVRFASIARIHRDRQGSGAGDSSPPVSSSSSSPSGQPLVHPSRHQPPFHAFTVVFITQPPASTDPDRSLWDQLVKLGVVRRSCLVWSPGRQAASLLSNLRLLGDDSTPAPAPPSTTLVAHLIQVSPS